MADDITAKEARTPAGNSAWLMGDALPRTSDAAMRSGTFVRVGAQHMPEEAVRRAEKSLKYLGYGVPIAHVANEPDDDGVSMEVRW